jgi:hypothetical protein
MDSNNLKGATWRKNNCRKNLNAGKAWHIHRKQCTEWEWIRQTRKHATQTNYVSVRKMIFSKNQGICYPLTLLKNASGRHLRWLACLKGPCFFFRIPLWLHCLPTACPNPSPSLLANWGRLWTFDLDIPGEGQVQLCQGYKEEPLSAILCLSACLTGVSTCLHPLDQEKLPCQDFLSLVCLFSAPEG